MRLRENNLCLKLYKSLEQRLSQKVWYEYFVMYVLIVLLWCQRKILKPEID